MRHAPPQQPTTAHQIEHIIIGTAGHIDHGKTSLVKALTGIDADRLPEEKLRGLTIDLGFAYLDLDAGRRVSIVDVPGHEKFVKNMLAGATSISFVLFVIAADDGIMPQTLEHLEIINLLGINHGLIALTKKDLVTDEWLAVVQDDIKKLLASTSLERAPVIPVSSVTGEGLEDCKTAIRQLLAQIKTQKSARVFRMSIDRSFTISGFGCVVTGPILGGQVSEEDEVELLPAKKTLRVRGIEMTGERARTAVAGQRAAINLSGVKSAEIHRGNELSIPGYLQPTNVVDVSLRLVKGAKNPLKNRARVRFHLNASEVIGRVVLLDRDALRPGEEAFGQIFLEGIVTVEREDRFILRTYSPAYTIGGGMVLRYNTARLKRFNEDVLKVLKILAGGNLFNIVEQCFLNGKGARPFAPTVDDISRQTNAHPSTAENAIAGLIKKGILLKHDVEGKSFIFHRDVVSSFKERILDTLKTFHQENPLKTGVEETHLKTLLGKNVYPALTTVSLSALKNEKAIKVSDNKLSLMNFRITVSTQDKGEADKIEEFFVKAGFLPPSGEEVIAKFGASGKAMLSLLVEQKRLIEVEKGLYFPASALNGVKELVKGHIGRHGPISVAQFRDLTKTSRKFAVPLLEYFDAIHFTKRTGDVRILM